MSKYGLSGNLNIKALESGSDKFWTPEECSSLITKFKEGYPTLTNWQNGLIRFAKTNGYTYTYFGRRRYLPNINSPDYSLAGREKRAAINTPVQSTGSDFMLSGVINMYQRLNPENFYFVATVHDSIVCEVRESYLDEWCRITKECLERPEINGQVIGLCNIMPFVAEMEVGDSYGTMEPYDSFMDVK